MKNIVLFLLVTSMVCACNTNNRKEHENTVNPIENIPQEEERATGALTLNGANKWKADNHTNSNISNLLHIIEAFNSKKDKPLAAYQDEAASLQKGLDKMINECAMKGPEHAALHHWLEPMLEKIQQLKKSTTIEEATTYSKEVENHINLYTQFFE